MSGSMLSKLRSNPAYSSLVEDLRSMIHSGKLRIGDRISGEVDLGEEYGISVTSVRRGIELLVEENLLVRKRGSGTYVTSPRPQSAEPNSKWVRPDTIAMVSMISPLTYHPYYSERLAGLRTGLTQKGWKLWEPELAQGQAGHDFGRLAYNWDLDRLWRDVREHHEFAGIVVSAKLIGDAPDQQPNVPAVSPDAVADIPFVAYSWEQEAEICLRHLLKRGCRNIWVLSVYPRDLLERAARQAAGALGVTPPSLVMHHTSSSVQSVTEAVQAAYELTRQELVMKDVAADGILVTSDFEVQGVMDALQDSACELHRPFVAVVNKESRLQLPRNVTRMVVDGYHHGKVLAETMHEWIVRPARAPRQVILNGKLEIYD